MQKNLKTTIRKNVRQDWWDQTTVRYNLTKNYDGSFDLASYGGYYYYLVWNTTKGDPNAAYHYFLRKQMKLTPGFKLIEEYETSRGKR